MSETENTSTTTSTEDKLEDVDKREKVNSETFEQMLDILDELLDHDHYFGDTYGSACNCQCQCVCQCRGLL